MRDIMTKNKFCPKAFWVTVKAFAVGGAWGGILYLLYLISPTLGLVVSISGAVGGAMYLTYGWAKEQLQKSNE